VLCRLFLGVHCENPSAWCLGAPLGILQTALEYSGLLDPLFPASRLGKTLYATDSESSSLLHTLILGGVQIGIDGLKFLRVMRVLRPLRLLNKIESLRLLVLAIKESASDMFNVLFLWAFMVVVFSICAVNLFAGKLSRCNDDKFVGPLLNTDRLEGSKIGWRENCVGNYYTTTSEDGSFYVAEHMPTPILKPRVWSNPPASTSQITIHFDNFPMAVQTLFEISTFEDWSDPIFYAVDVTDVGQQPVVWNSPWNVLFFHTWVVMSCFFVLQLVIGVLIDAINQKSGASLCTDLQRNWTRVKGRISMLKPIPREQNIPNGFRGKLWKFASDDRTQTGAMMIIVVNISIMASESYEQPVWWSHTTDILNIFFCIFYLLELIIRFVAYLHLFFLDPWNLFDLLGRYFEKSTVYCSLNLITCSKLTCENLIFPFRLLGMSSHFKSF